MEVKEEWRDIAGFEGLYQVSNLGRIKSLAKTDAIGRFKKERFLIPGNSKNGYLHLSLCKNGVVKQFTVHRLIATAFVPNPENKPCVDHIDCNRQNNRADNLLWVTYSENNLNPITRKRNIAAQSGENGFWYGKFGKQHNLSKPVVCIETGKFFWWNCRSKKRNGYSNDLRSVKKQTSNSRRVSLALCYAGRNKRGDVTCWCSLIVVMVE